MAAAETDRGYRGPQRTRDEGLRDEGNREDHPGDPEERRDQADDRMHHPPDEDIVTAAARDRRREEPVTDAEHDRDAKRHRKTKPDRTTREQAEAEEDRHGDEYRRRCPRHVEDERRERRNLAHEAGRSAGIRLGPSRGGVDCSSLLHTEPPLFDGLTRDQVLVDDAIWLEVHETSLESSTAVVRTGIDCHRAANSSDSLALVDMAVQAEQRLDLFDDLAHGLAAGRDLVRPPALRHVTQLLIHLIRGVEAAVIWRYVDVEYRPVRALEPVGQSPETRVDFVLVELARRIPGGFVREAKGEQLMRPDLPDLLVTP